MDPDKKGIGNGNSHQPVGTIGTIGAIGTIGSSRSNSLHSSPSLAADKSGSGSGSAAAPASSAAGGTTTDADLRFSGLDIGRVWSGGDLAPDSLTAPEPVPL